jgi:hypothetical protein
MALIFDEYDAGRRDVILEPQGKARARVLLTRAPFSAIKRFQRSLSRGVMIGGCLTWNDPKLTVATGRNRLWIQPVDATQLNSV